MDALQETQLRIIQQVTEFLRTANVPHWLFGGWAVDFLAGQVTRLHRDIEFIVWARDTPTVANVMTGHGYRAGNETIEMGIFFRHEQLLEFYYIEHDSSGQIITPGKWADWPWMDGAFDAPPARLADVMCPVTSIQSLLATKEEYAAHVPQVPMRDKDMADIEVLRGLLAR